MYDLRRSASEPEHRVRPHNTTHIRSICIRNFHRYPGGAREPPAIRYNEHEHEHFGRRSGYTHALGWAMLATTRARSTLDRDLDTSMTTTHTTWHDGLQTTLSMNAFVIKAI